MSGLGRLCSQGHQHQENNSMPASGEAEGTEVSY